MLGLNLNPPHRKMRVYCPEIEAQSLSLSLVDRCKKKKEEKLSDGSVLREDMPPLAGHPKGEEDDVCA